jgi:nicotinamide mononucleotide (NMN) deamidase PncC
MEREDVTVEVARILAEREWLLGTIECGVDGIVGHRFFETPDGPDVLGNSLVVDNLEEAIVLLDLPRPQFKNKGDFSAKAARAAAREGRGFLGVRTSLVVWAKGDTLQESLKHPLYLAINVEGEVVSEKVQVMGPDHLVEWAMTMLHKALMA